MVSMDRDFKTVKCRVGALVISDRALLGRGSEGRVVAAMALAARRLAALHVPSLDVGPMVFFDLEQLL